ncbi:DUF1919 domain-containing protein [Vibrio sp. HN007]|uniref:DUF1919 domain-containing protein n=1 Tax=Vibrio iocasae TaxID=3098914 RepID=UPI0035D455E3
MSDKLGRRLEKYVKSRIMRLKLTNIEFSIISNNCWGTFVYKQFDLPYQSPFINLLIYGPDYIALLEKLSPELLQKLTFISKEESKYKEELIKAGYYQLSYPIGLLDGKYEIHFLHYDNEDEARSKWLKRCNKINYEKLIVKFSDSNLFDDGMAKQFENLPYKNKVCFTAKPYENFQSIVYLDFFKGKEAVIDEWKKFWSSYNLYKVINQLGSSAKDE